jgi:DNA-binding GntR family transcriptional regulator
MVADVLRAEIERNMIAPGERLIETQVARRLNASQAPVREALRVLESEGLVEHLSRRGVYVKSISAREIEEVYTLRAAREGMTARRAMRLMTEQDLAEMRNTVTE